MKDGKNTMKNIEEDLFGMITFRGVLKTEGFDLVFRIF